MIDDLFQLFGIVFRHSEGRDMGTMFAFGLLILVAYVIAFLVIGIPGLLLKLMIRRTLATVPEIDSSKLLRRSLLACSLAGFITLLIYFFSAGFDDEAPVIGLLRSEITFALALTILVAALDWMAWRHSVGRAAGNDRRLATRWLLGSNAWILWAFLVLLVLDSRSLLSDCSLVPEVAGTEQQMRACKASPRLFWSSNSGLYEKMQAVPLSD